MGRLRTITGHLLLFAVGLSWPLMIMAGVIGWAYLRQEEARINLLAERQAAFIVSEIDTRIEAYRATLNVLAAAPQVLGGSPDEVRALLGKLKLDPDLWFTLRDRSGRQLVNTALPEGQPLPTFAGRGDPVIFDQGQPFTSNLIWAPATRQWAVTLSVPVRASESEDVRYALTLAVPAAHLQRVVAQVPKGWIAVVGDRDHVITARSFAHAELVGKPMATGARDLVKDVPPGQGGLWRNITTLEGTPVVGAYHRMQSTGWLVGVSALPEVYQAPRSHILLLGGLLAGLSLLLAGLLAFVLGRRITDAIGVLQTKAAALRDMRAISAPSTSLEEVNAVASVMRDTAEVLLAREEQQTTLIQELNHRVKNTLATIQSISRMTMRNAGSMEAFEQAFTSRLVALSTTHNLLTEASWSGVDLHELLATGLKPFQAVSRVTLDGPHVVLTSKIAVALGMALHEMATNAAKYGAGQGEDGHIAIRWIVSGGRLHLTWQERSGRPVTPPTSQGFGTRLIQQTISRELQGRADIAYEAHGVQARFEVPLNVSDRLAA